MATGRLGKGTQQRSPDAAVAWPAGKVCPACLNEGWTRRDLPTDHPAFGIPAQKGGVERCPTCHGASAGQGRAEKPALAAWLARDHAETARIRHSLGLPSLGQPSPGETPHDATAPPPDFARSGVPVPTTVTEEQRQRTQQRIAANVRAVAAKMDMEGAGR